MVCIGAGEIANQLHHVVELISTSSDATRIAHRSSIMAFFGSRRVISIDHIQKQRGTKKRQLSSGHSFQFLTFRLSESKTKRKWVGLTRMSAPPQGGRFVRIEQWCRPELVLK
jgi:hypothetical protein